MKKEAVNVFNDGLNYDLNPITTPKNVLTDCVNGTYLTFNGDELALQNDAGNTTISIVDNEAEEYVSSGSYEIGTNVYSISDGVTKYYKNKTGSNNGELSLPDWEEMVVRLSEGFYPIGIKEYGGILYIVSAKAPTNEVFVYTEDIPQTDESGIPAISRMFNKGNIVAITKWGVLQYYECLKYNVTLFNFPIPEFGSNDVWLHLGTQKDFYNKYGLIEFGSYPAPALTTPSIKDNSIFYEMRNLEESTPASVIPQLYKPKIINADNFQAGNYVTFNLEPGANLTNLSYQTFRETTRQEIIKKFYKIKLLHQLSNGFLDLTNNVWEQYAKYFYRIENYGLNEYAPTEDPLYWFNELGENAAFKYFCPNNYKGKLAISTELEHLDSFLLYPLNIEMGESGWDVTFTIYIENTSSWEVEKVLLATSVDQEVVADISTTLIGDYIEVTGIYTGIESLEINLKITDYIIDPESRMGTYTINGEESSEFSVEVGTVINIFYLGVPTGITITFLDVAGLVLDDNWTITVYPTNDIVSDPIINEDTDTYVLIAESSPNTFSFSKTFPISYFTIPTVRYKIFPVFKFEEDGDVNELIPPSTYFPTQFIDAHLIQGAFLLTDETNDFTFVPELNCEVSTGYNIAEYLILTDSESNYIDTNGEISSTPYGLTRQGTSYIPLGGFTSFGTFQISPTSFYPYAVVITPDYSGTISSTYLKNLASSTIAKEEDLSCSNYILLTITTNRSFPNSSHCPIKVEQNDFVECVYNDPESKVYQFHIQKDVGVQISVNTDIDGAGNAYDSNLAYVNNDGFSENTNLLFALVTKVYFDRRVESLQRASGQWNDYYFVYFTIAMSEDYFGIPLVHKYQYPGTTTSCNLLPSPANTHFDVELFNAGNYDTKYFFYTQQDPYPGQWCPEALYWNNTVYQEDYIGPMVVDCRLSPNRVQNRMPFLITWGAYNHQIGLTFPGTTIDKSLWCNLADMVDDTYVQRGDFHIFNSGATETSLELAPQNWQILQ